MPFIPQAVRSVVDDSGVDGMMCYQEYVPMIEKWRKTRRWHTGTKIYQDTFGVDERTAAKHLAFFVLFAKEIMQYEYENIEKHGDIR